MVIKFRFTGEVEIDSETLFDGEGLPSPTAKDVKEFLEECYTKRSLIDTRWMRYSCSR